MRGQLPKTKNNSYVIVNVSRNGKSFEVSCGRDGYVDRFTFISTIGCTLTSKKAPAHELEILEFEIEREEGLIINEIRLQRMRYAGAGKHMADQFAILTGTNVAPSEKSAIVLKQIDSGQIQAFQSIALLKEAVAPLIGTILKTPEGEQNLEVPIASLNLNIEEDLGAGVTANLNHDEIVEADVADPETVDIKLLNKKGNLDSGLRTAESIRAEVIKNLKIPSKQRINEMLRFR